MWRSEFLIHKLSSHTLFRGNDGDDENEGMHIFDTFPRRVQGRTQIYPVEDIERMTGSKRRQQLLRNAKVLYDLNQFEILRNAEIVEQLFDSIASNRESMLNFPVSPILFNSDKLDEWVQAYEKFREYHKEAQHMKKVLKRIEYENIIKGLKKALSNVVDTMNNFVLLYPFKFLKKSDAWFTTLAIASLDDITFEKMKRKTIDVWETLDYENAINKYGTNVTYILIDDFAWSGGQASQLANSICDHLRIVRYDTKDLKYAWFKAKPYQIPPESIVFVRAGVAERAIQVFKRLSDETETTKNTICLKYSFKLTDNPTSSLFTWCSNTFYKQNDGISASYGFTDHKIPDFTSTAIIMPFLTGIVCPYMFHGAQVTTGELQKDWKVLQDKFDIPGNVKDEELLHTWNTKFDTNEYKLTLDNGLVVFCASRQLNEYKFRPFLKNNKRIRLEQVTDDYIFAFSDTACVLMSEGELWSNYKLHKFLDGGILIDPEKVSWNEELWDDNSVFELNLNGKRYFGRNCVEDKVQSSYIQGILPHLNMQEIDPNGLISAFALCYLFGGDVTWGRPKSFYKEAKAQEILQNIVTNIPSK